MIAHPGGILSFGGGAYPVRRGALPAWAYGSLRD